MGRGGGLGRGRRGRVVVATPEGMHYETRGGNRRLDRVIPIFLS